MQSSQELIAKTTANSSQEAFEGSIAPQIDSKERKHSEMSSVSDEEFGPNYDILKCFPPLLCRYVSSHFDANEMLEMSTVSREWNKFVGEMPQVGKLTLYFDKIRPEPRRSGKDILLNSSRKYQNIKIDLIGEVSQFALEMLAHKAGAWKSVNIFSEQQQAADPNLFRKVLEIVEPTVEELSLTDVELAESFTVKTSWTFPCLKFLDCCNAPIKPFVRVASLVKIFCELFATGSAAELQTILRNNHNLKELIAQSGYSRRSIAFPTDIKFKLRKLTMKMADYELASENFAAFLATQRDNLNSLKLRYLILDQTLLDLILNMPQLKSLDIFFSLSDDVQTFTVNRTIESLHLKWIPGKQDALETQLACQGLIKAMPNLKHFGCDRLDAELVLCLMNFPALESIYTERLDIVCVPDWELFPKLKKFQALKYNGEYPTADHNFAKLVKKNLSS